MQTLPQSRLLRFVEEAFQLAQRAVARYSSTFSKQRYTLHQHLILLCLKLRKDTTYRTLLDELIEIPRIRNAINLSELSAPSILCNAFDRFDMAVWRVLLTLSVSLLPTNGVAVYGQRSPSEIVNSTLKRKYGAFVRSRRWWKQFRELALVCIVHNLDQAI